MSHHGSNEDEALRLNEEMRKQSALEAAAWELQRSFGREGSIYGIKACEEIARLAVATYQRELNASRGDTIQEANDIASEISRELRSKKKPLANLSSDRNEIIEECARVCEAKVIDRENAFDNGCWACANTIRALKDAATQASGLPEHVKDSANPAVAAPDRGDAVNLARNYVYQDADYEIKPTDAGIRLLADAVLQMDAWIREVTK